MPNKVGGKNYKKSKHQDDPKVYERLPGQMYGRVLKLLGGCNAMVFCNDNKERLCHIRGNMRRKVWIEVGDIVLISLRDLSDESDPTFVERGDICAKYDQRVIYKLQHKDKTINPKLFTTVESNDLHGAKQGGYVPDEDGFGFEFDTGENEIIDSDASSEDEEQNSKKAAIKSKSKSKSNSKSKSGAIDIDEI
jgi:translation initiation factor 1A